MARRLEEQVTEGARQLAEDAGNGLFSRSAAMVRGFFSGGLRGVFTFGVPLFILQFFPDAVRPITQAIGGDDLTRTVANLGTTDEGGDNLARRALMTAGIGAALGAAGGAGAGLINGNGDRSLGGSVVGIGMSLVAAAVVIGAVKNGNLTDNREVARSDSALPPRPANAQGQSQSQG